VKMSLGDLSGGGTPGNIPNPVVKPVSADGTWRATSRESRSLPRGISFNITHQALRLVGMERLSGGSTPLAITGRGLVYASDRPAQMVYNHIGFVITPATQNRTFVL